MTDVALLIQYLNGWNVDIDLVAANVDGNETVNLKDYALLKQYVNGWDVTLV